METVWSLVIVVLAAAAVGLSIWASDRAKGVYGALLPVAVASGATTMTWIIVVALGTGYRPGLGWIPWIVPIVVGIAACLAVVPALRGRRERRDVERLTEILKS